MLKSILMNVSVGALLVMQPVYARIPNDLNVVLIICDDLNDYEGFFGGHPQAKTPNMDALAASGITFVNAHSSAPICAPSRSSFMTGIYPHTSGNYAFGRWYNNPVLNNSKTLMHYFRDNGYGAFGTGKIMHHRLESEWTEYGAKAPAGPVAFDGTGFAPHPGIPAPFNAIGELNGTFGSLANIPSFPGYTGWYKANWVGAGAYNYVDDNNRDPMQDEEVATWATNKIAALDALGAATNFFLAVGFSNPHTPLVAPQMYFDMFPTNTLVLPASLSNDVADCFFTANLGTNTTGQMAYRAMQQSWPKFEDGLRLYLQAYLACTAFVDDQVGKVVDAVDASGFASNTVIILTSDHGYEFGEKESIAKNTLWENSTKVPLVFRVPGLEAQAGETVDRPVGLIDLYPTIQDLCGLTGDTKISASGADLDGHSMKPFLLDPAAGTWSGPGAALSMVTSYGGSPEVQNYSVRSKNWRYIDYENGDEELYDTANDPNEWTNVTGSASGIVQAKHEELKAELFNLVPGFFVSTSNLLDEAGFDKQTGSYPDAGSAPWFSVGEGNIWSFQSQNNFVYDNTRALSFNQQWDAGSVVQTLSVQLDTNSIYDASFQMLSHTGSGGGTAPSTINLELFSGISTNGPFSKRGDFVAGALNSVSNTWEYFSGSITGALFAAHAGEYLQVRITKPNGSTTARINIDSVSLTSHSDPVSYTDVPLPGLPLLDFDAGFDPGQLSVDAGTASVVSSNGNNALQLSALPGERVRVRLTPSSGAWNLADYVNLAMDIENVGTNEAWLRILIKDPTTSTESWYRPNCSHSAWVQSGETRIFPALMPRLRSRAGNDPGYLSLFPGMTGLPHAQMLTWYGIDVSQVSEVILELQPQTYAQSVRIDNLRGNRRAKPVILETDPNAFFPFIDQYGQYMHEEWPGKVHSDVDLQAAKVAEDLDLAAHPRTVEYDEYGGWANGPSLPATGHFRTEKIDGKWWFIDPAGRIFWSMGSTGVGLAETLINLDGAAHFYAGLPARTDPVFGAFYTTTGAGAPAGDYFKMFYPVLFKKYGPAFESTYNDRALERIRSWGLNTLGAWSAAADNQSAALKTPYTKIFWTPGKAIPAIPKLDDPFDPGFSNAVVTAINWTGSKNDPYCIGFFDNNEITWGANPARVIQNLMEDSASTDVAAKAELVRFLSGRYPDVAAANAVWGSSFTGFNDLLPALGSGNFNYPAADPDLEAFYAYLTDTYYRKCREALKSVAPDKLYLGSRIYEGSMRKEVAAAAAAHCDVVSFNVYHKDLNEFQGMKARDLPFFTEDKPYMVGEFTFGALDHGKFWTGIEYAADQRNRGEAFVHFIESGLNDPRCIGAHWFAYDDGATGGHYKPNVSENAAKGLIDSTDTPYYELVNAIRATGAGMYAYRYTHGMAPFGLWSWEYGLTGTDDDGDGLNNLMEFAMGGNPTNPGVNGYTPDFVNQGSNFRFIYPSRKNAGLLYGLETSTNLLSGVWTNSGYVQLPGIGTLDEKFDSVTNEIPTLDKQTFIRLNVTAE